MTPEGSHDGLWHLLHDHLLAAEARLVAVAAQGPQVDPPDGLRGERFGWLGLGVGLGLVGGDVGPRLGLGVDMA